MFWDSDTAKWLEAVGYSLQKHPDAELEKQADEVIDLIEKPTEFDLALRIPGWCRGYSLSVNGEEQNLTAQDGYVVITRQWQAGDAVTLTLDMPVERIVPHPHIRQDAGNIALQRGPVVYCLEEVDNGAYLANVTIPADAKLEATFDSDLFDGISAITGDAVRIEPKEWTGGMYEPQATVQYDKSFFKFKAIPYFLWANREPGEMRVWIREA